MCVHIEPCSCQLEELQQQCKDCPVQYWLLEKVPNRWVYWARYFMYLLKGWKRTADWGWCMDVLSFILCCMSPKRGSLWWSAFDTNGAGMEERKVQQTWLWRGKLHWFRELHDFIVRITFQSIIWLAGPGIILDQPRGNCNKRDFFADFTPTTWTPYTFV